MNYGKKNWIYKLCVRLINSSCKCCVLPLLASELVVAVGYLIRSIGLNVLSAQWKVSKERTNEFKCIIVHKCRCSYVGSGCHQP